MVKWIRSFCEQRTESVVVGQRTSALTTIAHAGIPQGSPLFPILYVFNPNLTESPMGTDGGSIGFVNDFTAWRTGPARSEITKTLQSEMLRRAEEWGRESGASFEVDKTSLIHFDRRKAEPEASPPLRFLDRNGEVQKEVNMLSVVLDAKLDMKAHTDKVVQAATKKCLAIRRLRGMRLKQTRQLYRTVIAATTDYAASAWVVKGRRRGGTTSQASRGSSEWVHKLS